MQFTTWITKIQKHKLYACKVFLQRFIGEKEKVTESHFATKLVKGLGLYHKS